MGPRYRLGSVARILLNGRLSVVVIAILWRPMPLRVALIAEGNAETRDCWSGCAQGFVLALRREGVEVDVFDVDLKGLSKGLVAAATFRPGRSRWRAGYRFGAAAFAAKSARAAFLLRRSKRSYDAIVQVGATFRIGRHVRPGTPRIVYADANIRFAAGGRPFAGITSLSDKLLTAVAKREASVYRDVTAVWTFSEAAARSFRGDFGVAADRVTAIYAGANTTVAPVSEGCPLDRLPRILFVGKDHQRKGSDLLLRAITRIREAIPDAELHFVGCSPVESPMDGVVCHGFIPAGTPEGARRIQDLYLTSSVFCLPSRYEPFGVSFVEAMLARLPCVGSKSWAMPEIIAEGETGWLVPDGDVEALAETLIAALGDSERSQQMGEAGRERALRLFTWDRVAHRAVEDLERLSGEAPAPLSSVPWSPVSEPAHNGRYAAAPPRTPATSRRT